MTSKLPGHMGPLVWLCRWPELLDRNPAWGPCQQECGLRDLSADSASLLPSLSLSDLQWPRPADFAVIPMRQDPGSILQCSGNKVATMGSVFPTGETIGSGGPLGAVLSWLEGEETWSDCSCSSYSSNVVFLDLCGSEVLQPHTQVLGFS